MNMKLLRTSIMAAISLVLLGSAALAAPAADAAPRGIPGAMMGGRIGPGPMGYGMMGYGVGYGMMGYGMGYGMMGGPFVAFDHVEGNIAFLRAELGITDAQNGPWNEFAAVLRENAKRLTELRAFMTGTVNAGALPSLDRRLDVQERVLATRLDNVRAIKAPAAKLYAVLSGDQKKTADQLLPAYVGGVGMMGMSAMMGLPGSLMMGRATAQ
jgi:hypothetical protein